MTFNNRIFVYGTLAGCFLKDALPDNDLHIKKRSPGKINARLFDLGEYPGAKPTSIISKEVFGEICEIDPEHFKDVLAVLDEYECYQPGKKKDSLFIRRISQVTSEDDHLFKAWVYWYNKPVNYSFEIESGNYKKYLKRNKLKKNAPK